jgi:hypothetical protein
MTLTTRGVVQRRQQPGLDLKAGDVARVEQALERNRRAVGDRVRAVDRAHCPGRQRRLDRVAVEVSAVR